MSKTIIQKIVVATVVLHRNKVLLLQRSKTEEILPGLWELPSGKRKNLESFIQTIKREVKEETGLRVGVIDPISTFEYIIEKSEMIKDTTQINYLVKVKGPSKVKISKEHQKFAWVKKKDLFRYKITKEIKKVISKI